MDEKYGWFYKMLQDVRENISGDAEIIAAAATVLAAFFIVAKMVKFHYRLSSDEEGGGLGDVKAWDFLKPIVLLFLISWSPQIGKAINNITSECMAALTEGAAERQYKATYIADLCIKRDALARKIAEAETTVGEKAPVMPQKGDYNLQDTQSKKEYHAALDNYNKDMINYEKDALERAGYSSDYYGLISSLSSLYTAKNELGITTEEFKNLVDAGYYHDSNETKDPISGRHFSNVEYSNMADAYEYLKTVRLASSPSGAMAKLRKMDEKILEVSEMDAKQIRELADSPEQLNAIDQYKDSVYKDDSFSLSDLGRWFVNSIYNMFIDVLFWVYQVIILIRLFMGNIFMCVMLYFFPLVFLAMMFDRYKGAFGSWIVTYVELALWQPIASILLYCSCDAMKKIVSPDGGLGDSMLVIMIILATIMAAGEIGTYAKYAMTAFNGTGGNGTGKSGLMQMKNMIR